MKYKLTAKQSRNTLVVSAGFLVAGSFVLWWVTALVSERVSGG